MLDHIKIALKMTKFYLLPSPHLPKNTKFKYFVYFGVDFNLILLSLKISFFFVYPLFFSVLLLVHSYVFETWKRILKEEIYFNLKKSRSFKY